MIKVVIDVGSGTGILSIFCAQAGAKRVYAIDASDIALQANEVVKANNLSDVVVGLHGRVEDVEIDEEVDVIISEWMGYMLLYESMLGSVINARDRWLKPRGLILPSSATLYMAPVTHTDRYMSTMVSLAKQCTFEEPSVEIVTGENVLTWPHVTLIYFYDSIELEQDKLIEGSVTLSQSKENARFMNIHLEYTWSIVCERVCYEVIFSCILALSFALTLAQHPRIAAYIFSDFVSPGELR